MTEDVSRRALLQGGIVLGTAAIGLDPAWARPPQACTVEIGQGKLRGIRAGGVDTYRGVPYAGSVAGPNRFKAAPPPPRWPGIRDATKLGSPAIQPPGGTMGLNEPAPSEDCLVLNIWTPTGGARGKPVMVYSHGGGLVTGSAGSVVQDGTNLARENDVVVVATNHRLGVMGFLYLDELGGADYAGSGNRGIQDIAVALKWVSENIAAFGGDPGNVMIFGESGGGLKTSCLYAMPQAAPYFHKASIESGPGIRIGEPDMAAQTTRRLLDQLGIAPNDWRRLLDAPAATLLAAQMKLGTPPNAAPHAWGGRLGLGGAIGTFGVVRDGHVMPHHPFDPEAPAISRDKPLLVGGNEDEQMFFALQGGDTAAWTLDEAALNARLAAAFGANAPAVLATYRGDRPGATPSELFFAIQSDLFSGQGSTLIAERKAAQGGAPAYHYVFAFDQGSPVRGVPNARTGAMHALDIAFKFNNMDQGVPGRPPLAGPRPDRYAAGKNMSRMWANFARTGRPSAPGQPAWPAYDLQKRPTLYIDTQCRVVNDPYKAERLFWEERS